MQKYGPMSKLRVGDQIYSTLGNSGSARSSTQAPELTYRRSSVQTQRSPAGLVEQPGWNQTHDLCAGNRAVSHFLTSSGRGGGLPGIILPGENFATLKIPKAPSAIRPNDCKTTRHAPDRESKIATHCHNMVPELCFPRGTKLRMRLSQTVSCAASYSFVNTPGPSEETQCLQLW